MGNLIVNCRTPLRHGSNHINMGTVKLTGLIAIMALTLPALPAEPLPEKFAKRDRNKDGKLSREEVPASFSRFKFVQADRNKDGFLDAKELEQVAKKPTPSREHILEYHSATTRNSNDEPPGVQ